VRRRGGREPSRTAGAAPPGTSRPEVRRAPRPRRTCLLSRAWRGAPPAPATPASRPARGPSAARRVPARLAVLAVSRAQRPAVAAPCPAGAARRPCRGRAVRLPQGSGDTASARARSLVAYATSSLPRAVRAVGAESSASCACLGHEVPCRLVALSSSSLPCTAYLPVRPGPLGFRTAMRVERADPCAEPPRKAPCPRGLHGRHPTYRTRRQPPPLGLTWRPSPVGSVHVDANPRDTVGRTTAPAARRSAERPATDVAGGRAGVVDVLRGRRAARGAATASSRRRGGRLRAWRSRRGVRRLR
jgi:hypothetical protein